MPTPSIEPKPGRRTRQATATQRMLVPKGSSFRVRMYRQGLGDCFLVAFPTAKAAEPFYMLIDCGVILGTADATAKMKKVAASIEAATGGRINVLVATHEHWDHLSGFTQAADEFKRLRIDSLWLAWTEDPADTLAAELRGQRKATRMALSRMMPRLRAPGAGLDADDGSVADRVSGLLGFFGVGEASTGDDTGAALAAARGYAGQTEYCRPGQKPIDLAGTKGVRVFVLGPPHDKAAIKHSDASASEIAGGTVYHLAQHQGATASFLAAADAGGVSEELSESAFPFDPSYRLDPGVVGRKSTEAPTQPATTRSGWRIGPGEPSDHARKLFGEYFGEEKQRWRRIDSDWLEVAADLALKLDSDTNNTSLALAIELGSGEVLLFPADAQVGNWTSWRSLSWKLKDGQGERTVNPADLLARTVLYKVGHHASHNATLRTGGLEGMGRDLVAMIPVDEEMARKKRWNMPFPSLLDALAARTQGRLARVDSGVATRTGSGGTAGADHQWKSFETATKASTDLYVDYVHPR